MFELKYDFDIFFFTENKIKMFDTYTLTVRTEMKLKSLCTIVVRMCFLELAETKGFEKLISR